ncbi:sugar epimerase [Actinobacteria bacterium YIM 96077]|uniref:Sugar epimerase n=1 Tax=Phytoactinopolyspora halophila TaxID=1981511 RepID=A0A329QCL3_9ACTN|nr:sugar phosphate isomerase/epimerase [Phytoactinopolyspora halophila]AYY13915.1 sugar epimerase [Actinobacteria bacterium YIM 96077]RAW10044.1 sugar epimerase [Phytoactinopolyspora halophila]
MINGIANAPVSFGIFELTTDQDFPEPEAILAPLRDSGYDGIDLGPAGWLGRGEQLQDRLREYGMALAGGWVDMPFTAPDAEFETALSGLDDVLEIFTAAAAVAPERPPLPTLADQGSETRRATPGGAPEVMLDSAGWERLAANVGRAAERVRAAGLEPTFHHHACTYVETPEEIDEFLARSDVDLTLDTGHLIIGGGDPVAAWQRWRDRINHLHVKDVRTEVVTGVLRERAGMRAVWERRAFVPLGAGDLDVPTFMDTVMADGFDGWLVVEQDVAPSPSDPPNRAFDDQRGNREALRPWLPTTPLSR